MSTEIYTENITQSNDLTNAVIITNDGKSYIDGGCPIMDKTNNSFLPEDLYKNQSLVVERHFDDFYSLGDLLKQYVMEQQNRKFNVANRKDLQYNKTYNTAVVASKEEGSE